MHYSTRPNIASDWLRNLPFVRSEDDNSLDIRAIAEQLHSIFKCFLEICEEQATKENIPTLGIVYNFIKEDMRFVPSGRCWIPNAPLGYITVTRTQGYRFVNSLNKLLDEVTYLSEYMVGLDAASEEIYTEPWIYAPIFKKARNRQNTKPLQNGKTPRQNIGFTYHVGEDYNHILSGLRHIDEVLTYFSYKPGDRIGHGLALQIDIREWLRNNEVVAIPVMEHLENMLWLWSCCGAGNHELGGILPQLENEIMTVAQRIYTNIRGLSPYVLWKAYTRKFQPLQNDFCQEMSRLYLRSIEDNIPYEPLPDTQRSFCALHQRMLHHSDKSGVEESVFFADVVWDIDKLLLTHYCPIYLRHYQKQMLVANPASYWNVFNTMQMYMRKKVERAGIYVETNPTSNMVIGDVPSLSEYRITSLNARGLSETESTAILISINSDDPLIFNTNVENELAVVYHTLLYHGFSYEEALGWIDKIRQAGMNSSFIRKCKPFSQQKNELETIMRELEQYFRK